MHVTFHYPLTDLHPQVQIDSTQQSLLGKILFWLQCIRGFPTAPLPSALAEIIAAVAESTHTTFEVVHHRKHETPITFDQHLARAGYPVALRSLNVKETRKFTRDGVKQEGCYQFQHRPEVKIKKAPAAGSTTIWCKTCAALREQVHECVAPNYAELAVKAAGFFTGKEYWGKTPHSLCHKYFYDETHLHKFHSSSVSDRIVQVPTNYFECKEAEYRARVSESAASHVPVVRPSTRQCIHANLREFTFTKGETITLCPDCGKDTGHDALRPGAIFRANRTETKTIFEDADNPIPTIVDLEEMITELATGKVNEASKMIFQSRVRQSTRPDKKVPKIPFVCEWCGAEGLARKGTRHCLDGNCRKYANKAKRNSTENNVCQQPHIEYQPLIQEQRV